MASLLIWFRQAYCLYSGYTGPALQRVAECYYNLADYDQARAFIQVSYIL